MSVLILRDVITQLLQCYCSQKCVQWPTSKPHLAVIYLLQERLRMRFLRYGRLLRNKIPLPLTSCRGENFIFKVRNVS